MYKATLLCGCHSCDRASFIIELIEYFGKSCTVHHLCYGSIVWDGEGIFGTCLFHLKLFAVFLTGLSSIAIARQPVTRRTPRLNT